MGSSQNFPTYSQSPAHASRTSKRPPLWQISEESPHRTSSGIIWDDRPTPVRNKDRVIGKRKSSSELSKEESENARRRRFHSSPVLVYDPDEKAKAEKARFEEFARLLKMKPSTDEKKISPKPRNLLENLNESLNDSVIDADKSLINGDPTKANDEDEEDSFMADEDMLASIEAEAVKTLLTQVKATPVEEKAPANNEMDEDDDLLMAIPLELLSGDNIPNEPISLDYRELTQRNKPNPTPVPPKLTTFQPKTSFSHFKPAVAHTKPPVASNFQRTSVVQPIPTLQKPIPPPQKPVQPPPKATENKIPSAPPVKCTPAEIQAKREEAKRRQEANKRKQIAFEKWQKAQQNKAKNAGGGGA